MAQLTDKSLLDKYYFAHATDGMSFALSYYERENKSRFFTLIKEYRPNLPSCSKCGPYVFENAASFSLEAIGPIQRELVRLTKEYHKDKPEFGMICSPALNHYKSCILVINVLIIAGYSEAPAGIDEIKNEAHLPWRRRNEAHPICTPATKRLYLPATRKFATYTTASPTPALDQGEFEEVSDEQLIEIARSVESADLKPTTDTTTNERLARTQ